MKYLLLIASALLLAGLSAPALADSREQVMLRLPRCAAITDTRQYVDCYYAAIQPVRTELGLERAPQSANYEALFALGTPLPQSINLSQQQAATRHLVVMRLTQCGSLPEVRRYMECYYGAVQPMRAELGLPPAPQAAVYASLFQSVQAPSYVAPAASQDRANLIPQAAYKPVSAAQAPRQRVPGAGATNLPLIGGLLGISSRKVPEAQFGLRNAPTSQTGVDHIVSRISDFELNEQTGRFTVTLENGQVWRQLPMDDRKALWKRGQRLTANIAYGASSSFNLSVGDRIVYKVSRVR